MIETEKSSEVDEYLYKDAQFYTAYLFIYGGKFASVAFLLNMVCSRVPVDKQLENSVSNSIECQQDYVIYFRSNMAFCSFKLTSIVLVDTQIRMI